MHPSPLPIAPRDPPAPAPAPAPVSTPPVPADLPLEVDAVVIGGGPGGSTAAAYLAKAGRSVLLLEKEIFPRFHVGESLLPYNRLIFQELGVLPQLEAAGFPVKTGAQFHIGNGSKSLFFVFRNGLYTQQTAALQVERATFDHILLKNAARLGAEVREGWTVAGFTSTNGFHHIDIVSQDGLRKCVQCRFLIDASGRANLTGNQEQLRQIHPELKKIAIFGHFKGVPVDEGEKGGDTVIVRLADKWFWLIPLPGDKVSVGCVLDQAEAKAWKGSLDQLFFAICRSSTVLRKKMECAQLLGRLQSTADFSYHNRRFVSERLLRVGDAAGFMDPIFSAGVFLAMHSGRSAAQAVHLALRKGSPGKSLLVRYEKRLRAAMHNYWQMVHHFYSSPFIEIFFEPREKFNMASAVNAALAGELDPAWKIRWRMRLFFLVIRIQKWWPLAPRVDFQEPSAPKPE